MSIENNEKLKVGISSCLLGNKVRFDGGHKKSQYINNQLDRVFEWIAVCPEVECGMPVPRESLRLEKDDSGLRLFAPKSGTNFTKQMSNYSDMKVKQLGKMALSGFILKKDSPSCGMERVRIYHQNGIPDRSGIGIFAGKLLKNQPLLPVEEEGRLNDPMLRENFIERVFAYSRLQKFNSGELTPNALVTFHTRHKLMLFAHDEITYRKMGKLVAVAGNADLKNIIEEYTTLFMKAMMKMAKPGTHTNILMHISGYFKNLITAREKKELVGLIEEYRRGFVPLVVPLTLIDHYLVNHPIKWLKDQFYLNPYPRSLMLRNMI